MFAALYVPTVTAVGSSLALTAFVSSLPLLAFFVLLGVFKIPAQWCAVISLGLALGVAIFGFGMPTGLAALSAAQGALFAFFPILFIVLTAVWNYRLTEETGRSSDVRTVFALVGRGDKRVQALLIGFAFCGLLEGLAGFGAPVAISAAMLYAIGLPPVKAALVTMVGNGINVGFGAMGIPITTVGALGGQPPDLVGATMGRITPFLVIWTPLLLLFIVDSWRGIREVWPAGVVAGFGMALGHFLGSGYLTYELTAVFASLLSFAFLAAFLKVWRPRTPEEQASEVKAHGLTASRVVLGLMPYWLIVLILGFVKLWRVGIDVPAVLAATDVTFPWPGLDGHIASMAGDVSGATVFNLQWLSAPGTMLLISGLIVSYVYGRVSSGGLYPYSFSRGVGALFRTVWEMRITILSIVVIMALAYVMNFSGQTVAIGTLLAATGAAFAFVAPFLGWLGTAVTGSATSSAALFANLQATAAGQAGINAPLLLGANEIGGGLGKIISPQNLTIAASSVRKPGSEPELLAKAMPYSLTLVTILGVLIFLASTGILAFVIA